MWGGNEHGNSNTQKAVAKVKAGIDWLRKVLVTHTHQCSPEMQLSVYYSLSAGCLLFQESKAPVGPFFTALYQTGLNSEDTLFKKLKGRKNHKCYSERSVFLLFGDLLFQLWQVTPQMVKKTRGC